MNERPISSVTWVILSLIFATSVYISTHIYISWDTSWLLEAARRFVAGGSYSANFLEPNPPLIIYLYSLAVFLSKFFGHLSLSFIGLTYLVAGITLALSYLILKPLSGQHNQAFNLLLIGLCFAELLLPSSDFGQREHLSVMLIMPYLFLSAMRIEGKSCKLIILIISGLMAGIGFAIKPHFVLPWLVVMALVGYQKRSLRVVLQTENLSISLFMFCYIIMALILNFDYFQFVLPLDYHFYLNYRHSPFILLLTDPLTLFVLFCLLTNLLQLRQKKSCYLAILQIFFLANLSYLFLYFIQKQDWYYHLLPSLMFSSICLILNVHELIQRISGNKQFQIGLSLNLLLSILMGSFLLALCCTWNLAHLAQRSDPNYVINQFLSELRTINQGPFMVISTSMEPNGSLLNYSGLSSSSRFPALWLLSGSLKLQNQQDPASQKLAQQGLELTRNIIIEDLLRDPPNIVLIDDNPNKKYFGEYEFDYVRFLEQDPRFRKLWRDYRPKSRINNYVIYTSRLSSCEARVSACEKLRRSD